jgi:hypothetical protein
VSSGGGATLGNSRGVEHVSATNEYSVAFARDVSSCVATATLAAVQAGPTLEQPQPGRITVATRGDRAVVKTFATDASPTEQPFHVMLAC